MKIVKLILLAIGVIVALIFLLAAFVPREMSVTRSKLIVVPYDIVYQNCVSLEAHNVWSPWNERDPNIEIRFEGVDGQVGSRYHWKGNKDVGEGYEELTAISDQLIETKLQFLEPWESEATTSLKLEPTAEGILVHWSFYSESAYPMNIMNLLVESQLAPDFEYGLNKLHDLCIQQEAATLE